MKRVCVPPLPSCPSLGICGFRAAMQVNSVSFSPKWVFQETQRNLLERMKWSRLNDTQDQGGTSWFKGLSCGKGTPGHWETMCVHVGAVSMRAAAPSTHGAEAGWPQSLACCSLPFTSATHGSPRVTLPMEWLLGNSCSNGRGARGGNQGRRGEPMGMSKEGLQPVPHEELPPRK